MFGKSTSLVLFVIHADLAPSSDAIGKACVSRVVQTLSNENFCRKDCKECDVCFGVTRIEDEHGFAAKFEPTSCGCLKFNEHPRKSCAAPHPPICAESCWRCAPCYEPLLKSDFIDVESTPVGHGDHCNGHCGLYEGDCDFDSDCLHGLVCGVNNCGSRLVNTFLNSRGVDIHPDGPPQRGGREPDCCVWPEDAFGTATRRGDSRLAWGEYYDYTTQNYGPYVPPTKLLEGGQGALSGTTSVALFSGLAVFCVVAVLARFVLKKITTGGALKYLAQSPTAEEEDRPIKGKRGWGSMETYDDQPTRTSTPESADHPAKVRDLPSALEKGDLKVRSPQRKPALPAAFPKDLAADEQKPLVDAHDSRKPARRTKAVERSATLGSLHTKDWPTKTSLDYEKLSVRELKQRLGAAGVSTAGAVEVSDLVELLRQHDAENAAATRPAPPASFPDGSPTRARKAGGAAATPPPPALFPDGSSAVARANSAISAAQIDLQRTSPDGKSATSQRSSPNRSANRRTKADRMPAQPPPLLGSAPAAPHFSQEADPGAGFPAPRSEDSASVISAGQISAHAASSKATSRHSGASGPGRGRKERKVGPRPKESGRTLADLM